MQASGSSLSSSPAQVSISCPLSLPLTQSRRETGGSAPRSFLRVIQQDGGPVTAIVNLAFVADDLAVATGQFIGDIAQDEVVIGKDFVFDEGDFCDIPAPRREVSNNTTP